ncbi:MAG: PD-(D/E)XK nuclease family protein, partial [Lewinella sp.]|nr:PD-(D/E)XK nuclease family protein [Lewinella sp.]
LSLGRTEQAGDGLHGWRDWLQAQDQWPAQLQHAGAIRQVRDWLESLHTHQHDLSLPALVETVLNESVLLDRAARAPDRLWQLQVCRTFSDYVRAELGRRPRLTLAQLLDNLQQMDDNHLRLDLHKDLELSQGVQLVTAHGAKGLEFDYIFLLDATKGAWEPSGRRGNRQFALPDTLTLSGEADATEARRRLFYVALTRARRAVQISYGAENRDGKAQQPSQFVDELIASGTVATNSRILDPEHLAEAELAHWQQAQPAQLPALEQALLAERLTQFPLSISGLNRYLDCPLRFFYETLLQAPQHVRPAAIYGTAAHAALQRLFDTMAANPDRRFPLEEQFIQYFEWEMNARRARFTDTEYERRLAQGRQHLSLYYRQHQPQWPRQVRTEMNILQAEVDGIPLRGIIDRVDFGAEQTVHIVDYKTGSHRQDKVQRPTDTRPHGGHYWRQLVFYKLLFEHRPGASQPVGTGTISYLDVDTSGQLADFDYTYRPEDSGLLRAIIRDTYRAIQNQEFYEGCGKDSCEWCRFVREDAYPPARTSEEIEELR